MNLVESFAAVVVVVRFLNITAIGHPVALGVEVSGWVWALLLALATNIFALVLAPDAPSAMVVAVAATVSVSTALPVSATPVQQLSSGEGARRTSGRVGRSATSHQPPAVCAE